MQALCGHFKYIMICRNQVVVSCDVYHFVNFASLVTSPKEVLTFKQENIHEMNSMFKQYELWVSGIMLN